MKKIVFALAAGILGGMLYSSAVQAQGALDHLICYKTGDPLRLKDANVTVDMLAELQPEFTQKGCVIGKPVEFCVPATKANVLPPPLNPNIVGHPLDDDYVCYKAKCPKGQLLPPPKLVIDQFGKRMERKYKPAKICVPAKKTSLGCGIVPGTNICGGNCPADPLNPTAVPAICGMDAAGACTCTPPTTTCDGSSPDKGGACGGTCPDPLLRCLPEPISPTSNTQICKCKDPVTPLCGLNAANGICGGNCPNLADKCAMDSAGQCSCQHLPPPCGRDAAGAACGGACPVVGQTCVSDAATNACICSPNLPRPCGPDPFTGTCGGFCQITGDLCQLMSDGKCGCQGLPCGFDTTLVPAQCGGKCPTAGQTCKTDATGACNCDPPSCGGSVTTGCNTGPCANGTTCRIIAATPLDYCGCQ